MIMSVFFLPCVQLRIQYAFRVQHPANIALLVIAAHFQVPLPLHVPMESSPCRGGRLVNNQSAWFFGLVLPQSADWTSSRMDWTGLGTWISATGLD